jgi:diadenosine tetraphosphate (Ap4A) HIT family hydrolase
MPGLSDPSNARTPEYAALLQEHEAQNVCPFDVGVFPEDQIIERMGGLILARNIFPYPNTAAHLLIFTERHIDDISEMTPEDWLGFSELFAQARTEHGAATGALSIRYSTEGNYLATGATVRHPHAQIVVPQLDPETGRVPGFDTPDAQVVNIRIG